MSEQPRNDAGTYMSTMGLALDATGGIWQYRGTYGLIKIAQANPLAQLPGIMSTMGLSIDGDGAVWQYQGSNGIVKIGQAGGPSAPPELLSPPVATALSDLYPGRNVVGSPGTWGNNPDTIVGQWLSNGVPIPGANGTTYTLQQSDVNHMISGRVTATNAAGSSDALSNSLGPVIEEPPPPEPTDPPVNTVPPLITILTDTHVGSEIASSTGSWNNNPVSYGRQWRRGSSDITGQTGPSYTLVTADIGLMITCRVTAINEHGSATADSNPVGPVVEPPEPPTEPDRPPPVEIPSWVLTNTTVYTVPDDPKPAYLRRFADPVLRTMVTRITGDPGTAVRNIPGTTWGRLARHNYNSRQAWSCDGSLLYITQNEDGETGARRLFLDGETYEPLFGLQGIPSGADAIWHPTNPNLMYYASSNGSFGTWNPRTGQTQVISNFGGLYTAATFGPWKWETDMGGDLIVISCLRAGVRVCFAYNITDDYKYPDLVASDIMVGIPGATGFSTCGISPLGTYMVWNFSSDNIRVTTKEGAVVYTLQGNQTSHSDMCIEGTGNNEVIVGRVNSGSLGLGPSGRIARTRLRDGQFLQLQTAGGWCSHTSSRAIEVTGWQDPGGKPRARWVVGDAQMGTNSSYPPYNGEILQMNLSGSATYRICHHHNKDGPDYDGQQHPSMSRDGRRIIFASSWGYDNENGNVRRPVSCYVADFRSSAQPNPPQNTTAPQLTYVTGSGAVGSTIACSTGAWTPTGTYTRRWYRNKQLIPEATGTSYTAQPEDVGMRISAAVVAVGAGQNAQPSSNEMGPITAIVEESGKRKR